MNIRVAKVNDLPELLKMAEEFISESGWGWTYNKQNASSKFLGYISDPECDVLITDGALALIATDNEFHDEKIGYISKFYVSKEKRGSGVGRAMIDACNHWFDIRQCREVFATDTSGINQIGKSFVNLLGKYGYHECGACLVRKK